MKRAITALDLADVAPAEPATPPPVFMMVRPEELLVDETYQRDLSDASMRLIRKIVAEWDWRKFKAPVVAMTPEGPVLIDGQHTSIGAASHPLVEEIPVLVVEAAAQEDQARAFVGINTSRLGITAAQLHHASVAAGDPSATAINRVCEAAGVRVLRLPPARAVYKAGETIAVAALAGMVQRQGEPAAIRMLRILVEAGLGPIQAAHIRAVETVLTDPQYAEIDGDDLPRVITAFGIETAEKDAKLFASTHAVPVWRALAATWFKARKIRRKPADPIVEAMSMKASMPMQETKPRAPTVLNTIRHAAAVEAARLAVPAPSFSGPGKR